MNQEIAVVFDHADVRMLLSLMKDGTFTLSTWVPWDNGDPKDPTHGEWELCDLNQSPELWAALRTPVGIVIDGLLVPKLLTSITDTYIHELAESIILYFLQC